MWQYNYSDDYLAHYGVLGMKWGVRRYQSKDGALTSAGKKRYSTGDGNSKNSDRNKRIAKKYQSSSNKYNPSSSSVKKGELTDQKRVERRKKAIGVGAAVVGTALVAYGTYKVSEVLKQKAYNKIREEGLNAARKYSNEQFKKFVEYEPDLRKASENNRKIMNTVDNMIDSSYVRARRASRNTVSAIKTLTNKNYDPGKFSKREINKAAKRGKKMLKEIDKQMAQKRYLEQRITELEKLLS